MDPHYQIVAVQDTSYESVPAQSYEYTTAGQTHTYSSREDGYSHPTPQTYNGLIAGHPTPSSSYPGYPTSAHAMEYVQSMYQMQIAQEMVSGFPDSHPYGGRSLITTDGRRKRRRIITHEQRKAANIRERRRMFHLNEAFDQLRKRVPTFAYEKKLSRIETLKLAVTYIKFMGDLVTELGGEPTTLDLSGSQEEESSEEISQSASSDQQQVLAKEEDSLQSSSSGEEE